MNALEAVYFYLFAALSVIGAVAVVLAKSPIRGAMGLLLLILSIAALFLALHAEFLAAIQLIVYAGAIVVLFLFVIMLLGPTATIPPSRRGIAVRAFGGGLFALTAVGALVALARVAGPHTALPDVETGFGGIEAFGAVLFSDALVPFEASSALLMVAVIGAIAVARGRQGAKTLSKSELAIARSAALAEPQPADTTGVFSHEIHLAGDGRTT